MDSNCHRTITTRCLTISPDFRHEDQEKKQRFLNLVEEAGDSVERLSGAKLKFLFCWNPLLNCPHGE